MNLHDIYIISLLAWLKYLNVLLENCLYSLQFRKTIGSLSKLDATCYWKVFDTNGISSDIPAPCRSVHLCLNLLTSRYFVQSRSYNALCVIFSVCHSSCCFTGNQFNLRTSSMDTYLSYTKVAAAFSINLPAFA